MKPGKRGRPRTYLREMTAAWRDYVKRELRDLAPRFLREQPTASGMFQAGFEAGLQAKRLEPTPTDDDQG